MNRPQSLTLGVLLALLVGATTYRATRATVPGLAIPGETVTGSKPAAGVPIILPGGASGVTYWPIRDAKRPHATVFLDSRYYAGYPNAKGIPTEPAMKGYWHTGLDLNGPGACNADQGNALHAVRAGVVEWVGVGSGSWGLVVVLRVEAEGRVWWCRYGHAQTKGKTGTTTTLKAGQTVAARDVIGYIGRGNWPCAHLHFDVFHTKPPRWDWWPARGAAASTVTAYCTDPDAWLRRLSAVNP